MVKLARIVDHGKLSRSQVASRFYKPTKEQDPVPVVLRDRYTAVQTVMVFVKTSRAFSGDGKGRLVSLSVIVASKEVADEMLRARETSQNLWEQVFRTGHQNRSDEGKGSHVYGSKHHVSVFEGLPEEISSPERMEGRIRISETVPPRRRDGPRTPRMVARQA